MPKLRRTRTIRAASFSFRKRACGRAPNALCLSLGAGQEGERVLTMTLCGQVSLLWHMHLLVVKKNITLLLLVKRFMPLQVLNFLCFVSVFRHHLLEVFLRKLELSHKWKGLREDIEKSVNEGVYQVEKLKEGARSQTYSMMMRKYSKVRKWTLGLSGGKDKIAIIRASGSISCVRDSFSLPGSSLVGEQFIEKIRTIRESKRYKAAIIRIDCPGGDALASDLMWREIKLLAASKPVIVSMSDVAASGGYYMAMAADAVVAENLTLTSSIGVVTGKFNLGKLCEKIGFNKEIISRGKICRCSCS